MSDLAETCETCHSVRPAIAAARRAGDPCPFCGHELPDPVDPIQFETFAAGYRASASHTSRASDEQIRAAYDEWLEQEGS